MKLLDKIYEKLKEVPRGKIVTYKILAESIGTKAYRAVGNIMNKNKYPNKIPCYKVVNSDCSLGCYKLGKREKIKRLRKEGIKIKNNKILNFEKVLYEFK